MKSRLTMMTMTAVLGILVLGAASVEQAAAITFNGGYAADPTNWLQADNWDLDRLPETGDAVTIPVPHAVTLSGGGTHTEYQALTISVIGSTASLTASLTIENNAHLTLGSTGWGPESPLRFGVYNINEGSTLRILNGSYRARYDGIVNINGGQHIVGENYEVMDRVEVNVTNGGLAKGRLLDFRYSSALNIDGGTAVFSNFGGNFDMGGSTTINFVIGDPDGRIIFTGGNYTTAVQSYIDAGWITNAQVAYGPYSYDQMGTNGGLTTYSGNGTIITAKPNPNPGTIILLR